MATHAREILHAVFIFLLKLQSLSVHLISWREADKSEAGWNRANGNGFVSLALGVLAGFPLCCLIFEAVIITEHCTGEEQQNPDVDWSLFTTWALKDLQKYLLRFLSQYISVYALTTYYHHFCLVSHSCPMAPAPRRCPTASASPPSSALIRRPPFTTPRGCSYSRSGNGPASPPSSRQLKSSPQSVLFNLLFTFVIS